MPESDNRLMRDVAVVGVTVLLCVIGFVMYGKASAAASPLPPQTAIPPRSINRLAMPVFLSRQFVEALDVPDPPQDLVDELLEALDPKAPQTGVSVATLIDRCQEQLDRYPDTIGVMVYDWGSQYDTTTLGARKRLPAPDVDHYEYMVQLDYGAPWYWPWEVSKPLPIGFEDAESNGPH